MRAAYVCVYGLRRNSFDWQGDNQRSEDRLGAELAERQQQKRAGSATALVLYEFSACGGDGF